MFSVGAYSWFTPVLVLLGVVLVAVVVGLIWRGRDGSDRRPGPGTYFLYGMSLVCLFVVLTGSGIDVHSTARAISPSSPADSADFPPFQPCPSSDSSTSGSATTGSATSGGSTSDGSTSDSYASTSTVPPDQIPCVNYGDSGNSGTPIPNSDSVGVSSGVGYSTLFAVVPDRDQYISTAVTAGLFALAGLIGYLVFWPRSRRIGSESEEGEQRIRQLGIAYGYLVAALSAVLLLISAPLAVDSVFRAIAPGVNHASGHADGIIGFVTFAVLAALSAIAMSYHLRYVNRLHEPEPPSRRHVAG